jgi:hypothetical protein
MVTTRFILTDSKRIVNVFLEFVKIEKGKTNYPVIRYRYKPRINKIDNQGVEMAESFTITTPGKSILFKI